MGLGFSSRDDLCLLHDFIYQYGCLEKGLLKWQTHSVLSSVSLPLAVPSEDTHQETDRTKRSQTQSGNQGLEEWNRPHFVQKANAIRFSEVYFVSLPKKQTVQSESD